MTPSGRRLLLILWVQWTLFRMIIVVGSGLERAVGVPAPALAAHRIDPNRARVAELELLPGLGRERAEAIVLHRVRHGRFRSADEVGAVHGIGPKTLESIRPWLRTESR